MNLTRDGFTTPGVAQVDWAIGFSEIPLSLDGFLFFRCRNYLSIRETNVFIFVPRFSSYQWVEVCCSVG